MIKILVVLGSIFILTSCTQTSEAYTRNNDFLFKPIIANEGIGSTLPPSYLKCERIEYNNQSTINILNITSLYGNHFKIQKNEMESENSRQLIGGVEKFCKDISISQNLKFGFEYDASRKTCICAYGERR